jgi:hypothetical protein
MKKIVDLEERIANKRQRESLEQYRGKIETIQKILQCSSCHLKCAMCGVQVEMNVSPPNSRPAHLGLSFCESCREELDEFLSISKGGKEPTVFWHNKEWKDMWSAWLDYRRAMAAFLRSSEFKLLMEELNRQS